MCTNGCVTVCVCVCVRECVHMMPGPPKLQFRVTTLHIARAYPSSPGGRGRGCMRYKFFQPRFTAAENTKLAPLKITRKQTCRSARRVSRCVTVLPLGRPLMWNRISLGMDKKLRSACVCPPSPSSLAGIFRALRSPFHLFFVFDRPGES